MVKPLQIRSLRQLVFISFLISLVPLVALLFQSQRDFSHVSTISKQNTTFFVGISTQLQDLLSSGQDLQRLIKQYQVLKDPQLKSITDSLLQSFTSKLTVLCNSVESVGECRSINESIPTLSEYHSFNDPLVVDAYLARFDTSLQKLQRDVSEFVDLKVLEQQAFLSDMQRRQTWSTGILVFLSLLFIMFSAQLIVKPVRKLQAIIKSIAAASSTLPSKSSTAPRELMAVEKDLYWLNERLNQLEKVRVALLRHASHELKTPLASIKEGCAILSDNLVGHLNDSQKEVLRLLENSTERLNLLIERLLDYNALLQQAEPDLEDIQLNPILKDCIRHHQLILQQNDQEIALQFEEQLSAYSDAELLRRIIDNLVSNAIAYGAKSSCIVIEVSSDEHFVILRVKNKGNAIPVDVRTEIFEPFKRGGEKRNDKVMGAGLGLSIVSDCTKLLGGKVSIIDVDDADVCFQVLLPIAKNNDKR